MRTIVAATAVFDNRKSFLAPMPHDHGCEVREAATVTAAHLAVDRNEADIIGLDGQLPDGYGPSRLERLKREQPGRPVIAVTGYGDIETAVEAMKLGAMDFIQKPVGMARLCQAVDKAAT